MNGIKLNFFCVCILLGFAFSACQELNKFVEDVFVYEPQGTQISIAQLKEKQADAIIEDEIYVQGTVISSDANGNFARQLVLQDASGAVMINIDMGSSNEVYPYGAKVSVQCKGLMLADIGGLLQLSKSVVGDGMRKEIIPLDNRLARNRVFNIGNGDGISPAGLTLSQLDAATRAYENQLVSLQNVFFQTTLLPFANAGGSSEQFRTLYDSEARSVLLCTRDGATMANEMLPKGKGSVTGVLTYSNGVAQIMVKSIGDIEFTPSSDTEINDPDDHVSDILLSEYFNSRGMCYVEIFNAGSQTVNLSDYAIATDNEADGNFTAKVMLDEQLLAPGGIVLYRNSKANLISWTDTASDQWQPLRTNRSAIRLDALSMDGNSQIAILKGNQLVDILSSTNKYNWAEGKTLIRRPSIVGHSKASDFTRADAGWITKMAGYAYNLGHHRFFDTDPDMDNLVPSLPKTIIHVRSMEKGLINDNIKITGRVSSDRVAGNVAPNCLFMQDDSNRGICVLFREGQNHLYNAGDEVEVDLYGAKLEDRDGLLVIADAAVSRSQRTVAPPQAVEPLEASVSQINNLQSMYIYIKDVQVQSGELSKTYGSGNVGAEDLFANEFFVSTGSDASFASSAVTQNSGIIKGIASVSGSKLQIMPRNSKDMEGMTDSRFVPVTATPITIAELRKLPTGVIPDNVRVTGSVVSDLNSNNDIAPDMVFVQDEKSGFLLKLPSANKYQFGQSVIVVLKGASNVSQSGQEYVVPASAADVIAIGAPDPSIQPSTVGVGELDNNLYKLVSLSRIEVTETDRLKRFDGPIQFRMSNSATDNVTVMTSSGAAWKGNYIPTAVGSVVGLLNKNGNAYVLYPRKASDLAGLPVSGKRLNGEQVVYFRPSTDPDADLFISEAVIGQLDVNGVPLASVARNNCNSKFVELFNPTANNLVMSNYRVACVKYNNSVARGTVYYYQFPADLELTPGRTIVFKYVSTALGTGNGTSMTNTIWPKSYKGDADLANGEVKVVTDAVPGVILICDARDKTVSIANATKSFPCIDGNDLLVVQKTTDGGATWKEIDRVFKLVTANNTVGGGVSYPYLFCYQRKAGKLGLPGNITDVQNAAYDTKDNDFNSTQCDPKDGVNWIASPPNSVEDLGVHSFSIY